jgi:general secretion pathway protein D
MLAVISPEVLQAQAPPGQRPAVPVPVVPNPPDAEIELNFPEEIEVRALVDLVSNRLKVRILYDEQIANKKITIRSPGKIPVKSLLAVLESALKMKGLVLVDADAPGWKRIVPANLLPNVAAAGDGTAAVEKLGAGTPVTEAFVLKHADPTVVEKYLKPFLTEPGANSVAVPESKTLIVTDYAGNILKLSRWIDAIDQPKPNVAIETLKINNVEAGRLATQLQALIVAKLRAQSIQGVPGLEVTHDDRTNHIFLIGDASQIALARQLIEFLDVPLELLTRTYNFRNISADRIDKLVQELITPLDRKRLYRSAVDAQENLLIVTTTLEIHRQIEKLRDTMDVDRPRVQSPIKYYKIKNLPVGELLQTIRSIEQQTVTAVNPRADWQTLPTNGSIRPARAQAISGPNLVPGPAGDFPPPPPSYRPTPTAVDVMTPNGPMSATITPSDPNGGNLNRGDLNNFTNRTVPGVPSPAGTTMTGAIPESVPIPLPSTTQIAEDPDNVPITKLLGQARITADLHTNTLIVLAEPQVQKIYAELIEKLDQRRPQVLIEAKVVIIDTTGNFSFGVEVSGGKFAGAKKLFAFSSYGLSEVDPATGALSIIPGLGFNGTLVDPRTADVVIRALTTRRKARIVSAPRVVVNDNATGQLSSVQEVPFTSVNASQTVATTSFAGFAEAGTTITATPRISDDNHLQLDFAVTLNSFTGTGSAGIPPPRQTEEVTSQVTIPDGYTVIVGGLNRSNDSHDYQGFPWIDQIPILKFLLGNVTISGSRNTMFVFIKPIILRDDKFKELKFVSDRDICRAKECPNFPESRPVWIP